jgi:hypothetical protein
MKRLALSLVLAAVGAAVIPSTASAQSGGTAYDACYAKDGALDGSFSAMWEGDPSASPVKPGCDEIALSGNRVAVRTSGKCWAKDGLTGSFNLMSDPTCAHVALGDNRIANRNSDGSCWAKEGMWGGWNLMSSPGCMDIALGDNRMVKRDSNGSCWAKEGMFGAWNLMSNPGCLDIALGDNRIVKRDSNGSCWAKEGMFGAWNLMWYSSGTCASVVVGGGRIGVRSTDGKCRVRDGMTGDWQVVWDSGCAQVALGGTRIGIRTTDDRCYARDGMTGAWVPQWEFTPCADIVLTASRVGIRVDNPANVPPTYPVSFSDSFEATQNGVPDFPKSWAWAAWCSDCGSGGKQLDGSGGSIDQVSPPSGVSATDGSHIVDAGLTPTSTRAEIQCHRAASYGSDYNCAGGEGTEFVYQFDIRIPSGYTLPGRASVVMQTKPTSVSPTPPGHVASTCYGGGVQAKTVTGDASKVELLFSSRAGAVVDDGYGFCTTDAGTLDSLGVLPRDMWHRITLRAKWSTDASVGFIQVWVNGREVLPKRNQRTLIDGTGRVQMFKIGLYESQNADIHHATYHAFYDNVVIRKP